MDFRFGVALGATTSRMAWMERCRRAEALGFDVIGVPDHLGMLAPFPAMLLAAEATERVRLTTEAAAAERIAHLNSLLGDRAGTVEINLVIQALLPSGTGRPEFLTERVMWDEATPEAYVSVLVGTPRDMADRLLALRERLGIGYVTVIDHNLEAMARVVELLRA